MQGRIIKGVAGQYEVLVRGDVRPYVCKAKGIFRKEKETPMVGDFVEIAPIAGEEHTGSLEKIYPRKNQLLRPAVSNIDQALVVFSISNPKPNYNLLDRFLIHMAMRQVDCVILFSKEDLQEGEELRSAMEAYQNCGAKVLSFSVKERTGLTEITEILKGKTSTVAGPSGVGKSSLINHLQSEVVMEVGSISEKIDRGKHTTRHSQLIALSEDTFILDTPGFSSLEVMTVPKEDLSSYYPEFAPWEGECRFGGCSHIYEPVCGIRQAVEEGKIPRMRYENYKVLYEQIKEGRKNR